MISSSLLTVELSQATARLERDLHERVGLGDAATALRAEYRTAVGESRSSATWSEWLHNQVAQVATSWVLATVMLRFCEDNHIANLSFATGTKAFPDRPSLPVRDARDSIIAAVDRLRSQPAMATVFDRRSNPLWKITPSREACEELLSFWRRRTPDGTLVHDFADESRDTRFLQDLYVGLNEQSRKSYALVTTPPFVADLILDLTLDPAIEEFASSPAGLAGFRTIDPACGSGTFLISAFDRLFRQWSRVRPDMSRWQRAARALRSIHGCDLNPCAVSITRFRLVIAAMNAADEPRLDDMPDVPIVVASGDSLLHGKAPLAVDSGAPEPSVIDSAQDLDTHSDRYGLLGRASYHAVVSDPPYITVKDKALSKAYQEAYPSCSGRYALTVPFTELAFDLAVRGTAGGYVGELLANSFMKREFGRKLVEDVLSRVEISHVIDTSGAYIPGHGTPTVILAGRNRVPDPTLPVHTVVGLRGEPFPPPDPSEGAVWQSLRQTSRSPAVTPWTESFLEERSRLTVFPWTLAGSSAKAVLRLMERGEPLEKRVARIGYGGNTGSDDIFCAPPHSFRRYGTEDASRVPVLTGSGVRDWSARTEMEAFFPRTGDGTGIVALDRVPRHHRRLWPYRSVLGERTGMAHSARWYDWHQVATGRYVHPWGIVFPWVSTHPHFSLLRDTVVPLNSAPVIKLSPDASEEDHLRILGVLNTSMACFWLKQMSQSKGGPRADQLRGGEAWEKIYEFTSTRLLELPLPASLPLAHAAELDRLATVRTAYLSELAAPGTRLTHDHLKSVKGHWLSARSRMVALQEELDWRTYAEYGLLPVGSPLTEGPAEPPSIEPGQRAFEIALARRVMRGEASTMWFERHGTPLVTEVPGHWPSAYQDLVRRRIDAIEENAAVALLEQPEYKHRWSAPDWDSVLRTILRDRMLDRCENPQLWFEERVGERQPVTRTVGELAELLAREPEFTMLAALHSPDARILDVVQSLIADAHVPEAAALRYKASGLRKRAQWEALWAQQWQEDHAPRTAGRRQEINVDRPTSIPPRYTAADFVRPSYWYQRGKFDTPNERFTSYLPPFAPVLSTTLIGWAGWDARERALALLNLFNSAARPHTDSSEWVLPAVAALREVLAWIPRTGAAPGPVKPSDEDEVLTTAFERLVHRLGIPEDTIASWRPPAPRRGRPRKT
ncbi:BREX-2 system adenine-specific DNA-methyltransferase PglX [Streptomyces sp. NPDC050509]|uniref:BREX-2 system adenine-specific DNA-methyltransferase PglX n=1 Tax=Streptomyces sp. NPDC050509 TaxID=3365620 RepID=UPI003794DCD1